MDSKDRLLLFISNKGIGQGKFEEIAKISNGYINNNKGSIGSSILAKIGIAFPNLNTDWVATGNGSMLKEIEQSNTFKLGDENYRLIPLCSHDVVGGVNNQEMDTNGYITGYLPFVNASKEDICVPVTGYSMMPIYSPGCVIQIRKIEFWQELIELGKVHILELNDERRLIKYVRQGKDDDFFRLVSANLEYDDIQVRKDFIRNVWLVIAKYEKVVM